jgi:hypothetical protein
MRFIVRGRSSSAYGGIAQYPTAVLLRDNWNDYGYNTMFSVRLHLSHDRSLDLENVKILQQAQESGLTPLPRSFEALDEDYCSLGQAFTYYEALHSAGPDIYRPYLEALRDAAYLPDVLAKFEEEDGFETSLLRFDGARRALKDAISLFERAPGAEEEPATSLDFAYQLPGMDEPITFSFGQGDGLPDRLCVVIGYNGAGKTHLLGELAHVAYADEREAASPPFVRRHGHYVGDRPEFGAVLAVSYSAFDTFALPGAEGSHRVAARNYTYCGLRQVGENRGLDRPEGPFAVGGRVPRSTETRSRKGTRGTPRCGVRTSVQRTVSSNHRRPTCHQR